MSDIEPRRSHKVVTVFGSSRARPGDQEYADAVRLGRLLAERGWTLCNGGHDGTMEAAARGAKEVGGQTIGVTFNLYRPANRNIWLDQEIVTESLFTRLEKLVTLGDAYVVLRGGIGTLLELCLVWNLVQSPEFVNKPILVVGASWGSIVGEMRNELPMHPWEADSLELVGSVDEAVERLKAYLTRGRKAARMRAERDAGQVT
jgi:uncharacterized protein (TIGR00730 family)